MTNLVITQTAMQLHVQGGGDRLQLVLAMPRDIVVGGEGGSEPGPPGDSAYQVWLAAGHSGTEADFLASLKGAPGDPGTDGDDGDPGASAYQIWLAAGHSGTEADFLASLKGAPGDPGTDGDDGDPGASAYQVWLANGHSGSEGDFLAWLQGVAADPEDWTLETAETGWTIALPVRVRVRRGVAYFDGAMQPDSAEQNYSIAFSLPLDRLPAQGVMFTGMAIAGVLPSAVQIAISPADGGVMIVMDLNAIDAYGVGPVFFQHSWLLDPPAEE